MKQEHIVCRLRQLRLRESLIQPVLAVHANKLLAELGTPYPRLNGDIISLAENEKIVLIPNHVHAIATFLDCSAHDIYPMLYPEDGCG